MDCFKESADDRVHDKWCNDGTKTGGGNVKGGREGGTCVHCVPDRGGMTNDKWEKRSPGSRERRKLKELKRVGVGKVWQRRGRSASQEGETKEGARPGKSKGRWSRKKRGRQNWEVEAVMEESEEGKRPAASM